MTSDRDAWTKHVEARAHRPSANCAKREVEPLRITLEEPARPQKYGARVVLVDGVRFDSTKEAKRYSELKLLQAVGQIQHLELQPCFPLQVVELWRDGPPWTITHCGVYTGDFKYIDCITGEVVVEDTKSGPTKTEAYRLRKKIAEAVHGITIREV